MTVRELMVKLADFDDSSEIYVASQDDNTYGRGRNIVAICHVDVIKPNNIDLGNGAYLIY